MPGCVSNYIEKNFVIIYMPLFIPYTFGFYLCCNSKNKDNVASTFISSVHFYKSWLYNENPYINVPTDIDNLMASKIKQSKHI